MPIVGGCEASCRQLFRPTMRVLHRQHRGENVVPSLWLVHDFIGEHAAVPADVPAGRQDVAVLVAKPEASVMSDVELAVGIIGQTVATCLVMAAGTMHGGIVLSHMKIDRPGPQHVSQLLQRRILLFDIGPVKISGQNGVFRSVVTEKVQQRVSHVGLETKSLRVADSFQQVGHLSPALHTTPTDLAFRRETFVELLGDVAGRLERVSDLALVVTGIGKPI